MLNWRQKGEKNPFHWKKLGVDVAVVIAFLISAKVGYLLSIPPIGVSPAWPPSGFCLAAVLYFGHRAGVGIFLGSLILNLWLYGSHGANGILAAFIIASGTTAQSIVGVYLLRGALGNPPSFRRATDVFRLTMAGSIGCAIKATCGFAAETFLLGTSSGSSFSVWFGIWAGDLGGMFIFTPFLLAWAKPPSFIKNRLRAMEGILCLLATFGAGILAFGPQWGQYPLKVFLLPVMLWAGFRLENIGVSTAVVIVSWMATIGCARGLGPFGNLPFPQSLIFLQATLWVFATTGLMLSCLLSERKMAETDIAEKEGLTRSAQAALMSNERRLRAIIDQAALGIAQVALDGRWVGVNQQLCDILEYTEKELTSKTFMDVTPTEDLPKDLEALRKLLTGDSKSYSTEKRYVKKSGKPVWVNLSVALVRDSSGNPDYLVSVIEDISEKRATKEALQQLNEALERKVRKRTERLRTLAAVVESSNDFIGICTPQFKPIYLNTAGQRMVGLDSMDTVKGTKAWDFFWPEDRPMIETKALPVLNVRERWSGECRFQHFKTKKPIHTILNAFLIRNEQGEAVAWATISPNLNRIKDVEMKLRASLLEKEVLLKEIHHRVKNNLNVISSLLDLQLDSLTDGSAIAAFKESQSRIHSIALIHEKLYQSKDFSRISFADYAEELLSNIFQTFGANNCRLRLDVSDSVLPIDKAIPCGLILTELVSNSLKYAFPNGRIGEVAVSFSVLKDLNLFELVVKDNGIGLPPVVDINSSSSLGLQLVTLLAKQIEATVDIQRGQGTKFVFRWDLQQEYSGAGDLASGVKSDEAVQGGRNEWTANTNRRG